MFRNCISNATNETEDKVVCFKVPKIVRRTSEETCRAIKKRKQGAS